MRETDIKKRRYNATMGDIEPKEKVRELLVLSLVYLFRHIVNLESADERENLKANFFDVMKELMLTEKEKKIFSFESNNMGV